MYGDETKVTLSEGSPSGLSLRPRESAPASKQIFTLQIYILIYYTSNHLIY